MLSIGKLAVRSGLSRSALLYYDRIGLLCPSARDSNNYRRYTEEDAEKLIQICMLRNLGLTLTDIKHFVDSKGNSSSHILKQRLYALNGEITALRTQQQAIIALLGDQALYSSTKLMTKQQWVNLLRASGLDDVAMKNWHIAFERDMPNMHTDFLQSLGIDEEEIAKIKAWAK